MSNGKTLAVIERQPGRLGAAKAVVAALALAFAVQGSEGGKGLQGRLGVVSDWRQHHVLYPTARSAYLLARNQRDPAWLGRWLVRHPENWWPRFRRRPFPRPSGSTRDWNVSLGTATFGPVYDFSFNIPPQTGYGSLSTADQGGGVFLATEGSVTVTGGADQGTYPLFPGGPGQTTSPAGAFIYDDLIYPQTNPPFDEYALLLTAPGLEINIWGNSPNNYSFYDHSGGAYGTQLTTNGTVTVNAAPSSGQTYAAKYVFDVTAAPNCTNDYVVMGIAANAAGGGQANIVGLNNLYSTQGASLPAPLCGTSGPTVMFAYASGTGGVPNAVTISLDGSEIAYTENLSSGSSYFHVLTIGTTGSNGTSATAAAVPGVGNNAVDHSVLLSPDGGTTNQSSTNAPFVAYTAGDANDVAYATTYSTAGSGSGYLYKIVNVFNGGTPSIEWSAAINAIPSTPVFDPVTSQIFFTDSAGRIDCVTDNGATPSAVVYGPVVASGTTSENPVMLDMTNQMVYAAFNSDGTTAVLVQAPVDLSSSISAAVGTANTLYGAPYLPAFNNAWYGGAGTPLIYVAGTGSGTVPTLYAVGFTGGLLNPADVTSTALATGMADSSPVTEFYNALLGKDYIFVGVTNHCVATTGGGTGGCVMSLDVTSGFPTVNAGTTALAASGGVSGIIIDNDSSQTQASSIYYSTKTGSTLVKATQSGLN